MPDRRGIDSSRRVQYLSLCSGLVKLLPLFLPFTALAVSALQQQSHRTIIPYFWDKSSANIIRPFLSYPRTLASLFFRVYRDRSSVVIPSFRQTQVYSGLTSPSKRPLAFAGQTRLFSRLSKEESSSQTNPNMADVILSETVPRTTGCDPASVSVLECIKAKNVCFTVRDGPSLSCLNADTLIIGVPGVCAEEADMSDACQESDSSMSNGMVGAGECVSLIETVKKFDDEQGDGALSEMVKLNEFKGKTGSWCASRLPSSSKDVRNVSLVGFGNMKELSVSACAKVGTEIAVLLSKLKVKSAAFLLPEGLLPRQAQAMVESLLLSTSPDNRFKSVRSTITPIPPLEKMELIVMKGSKNAMTDAVNAAVTISKAVYFAQQLVAAPANYVNPITLAHVAAKMARDRCLTVRVLDKEDIEKLNMGAYLAVAKGSMFPPRFIHLTYTPANGVVKRKVALIGKGICFDAGGYNIKSAASQIELMKIDMGGAAAVLGAAYAIGEMKPANVEVHFIVAAAENMVSDKAYRPGDIIVASNGKTIEVGNTDAEGRLTLADALVYASKLGPDVILDVATLTGACIVALGPAYAGLFSPQDALSNEILESGKASGEFLWRLPIVKEYREMIDSKIADMNNVGGGGKGGSITAALFLTEFVSKTPWAHIDMAGPAWDTKESKATGFGVRTLTEFIIRTAANPSRPLA